MASATGQAINVEWVVKCAVEVKGELLIHNVFAARNLWYDVKWCYEEILGCNSW